MSITIRNFKTGETRGTVEGSFEKTGKLAKAIAAEGTKGEFLSVKKDEKAVVEALKQDGAKIRFYIRRGNDIVTNKATVSFDGNRSRVEFGTRGQARLLDTGWSGSGLRQGLVAVEVL